MISKQRALLRMHIEAVWNVHLPPLVQDSVELLSEEDRPFWQVYLADIAGEQIVIWRPDIPVRERQTALIRLQEALKLPATEPVAPEIRREVMLSQEAAPTISRAFAQQIARPLTPDDQNLVERFDPGSLNHYYHPKSRPLMGVVIGGRLLSVARSSRRSAEACELGIDTLPEGRRKGYALAATVLWAASVAQEGRVPLYSASADNTASLALAASAGYRAFARSARLEGTSEE